MAGNLPPVHRTLSSVFSSTQTGTCLQPVLASSGNSEGDLQKSLTGWRDRGQSVNIVVSGRSLHVLTSRQDTRICYLPLDHLIPSGVSITSYNTQAERLAPPKRFVDVLASKR